MPKRVDHQERRTRIADALIRVAAEQGLEAVSLRHVAAEAGVTAGMVQHYFSSKDDMMRFALEVVRDYNEARVTAALAPLGEDPAPRWLLRAMIGALLPLDEESIRYGRVALAFHAYTAVRPEAAKSLRESTTQMLDFVADLLAASGVEPRGGAAALLALMEGLGVQLLGGHFPPELAEAALDAHLDLLFPDED